MSLQAGRGEHSFVALIGAASNADSFPIESRAGQPVGLGQSEPRPYVSPVHYRPSDESPGDTVLPTTISDPRETT